MSQSMNSRLGSTGFRLLSPIPAPRTKLQNSRRERGNWPSGHKTMHPIRPFINQHGDRRVGTCVRQVLHHLLHDERIPCNEPLTPGCGRSLFLTQDFPAVKTRELHQVRRSNRLADDIFQFSLCLRCGNVSPKQVHVRMPDGGVERRHDIAKRFRGRHAKSLNSELLYTHLEFLLKGRWKDKGSVSRRPRSPARLDSRTARCTRRLIRRESWPSCLCLRD